MRRLITNTVRAAVVVLFVLLGQTGAGAQTATPGPLTPLPASSVDINEPARALKEGKLLRAMRVRVTPPAIDGSLSDEVWTAAESAGEYIQRDPDNGVAMTEATRIQVAYDDRYLYIAVVCEDGSPAGIGAGLG